MPSSTSNFSKFVRWFLTAFTGLVVFFALGSEILIREKVEPNHNFYKYLSLFRNASSSSAIFGDSHAAYGLTGLTGVINLAYGGESIFGIREKIEEFYRRRRPNLVILQAGLHHFSRGYERWRPADSEFIKLVKSFDLLTPRILIGPTRQELFGYWEQLLQSGEFRPKHRFLADGSQLVAPNGKYLELSARRRQEGARRFAYQVVPVTNISDSPIIAIYQKIIGFIRKKGGNVCLVTFPVTEDYKNAARALPEYGHARNFFKELSKKNKIPYVYGWAIAYPNKFFDDYSHLNSNGARVYSPEVLKRCLPGSRSVPKEAPPR